MARVRDDLIFTGFEGPLAVVRACRFCDFRDIYRKGGGGRGGGFVRGNQSRGRLIEHVKAEHSEEYQQFLQEDRDRP